jgi:hypothetical protein
MDAVRCSTPPPPLPCPWPGRRCYNGQLYGPSAHKASGANKSPIRPGDRVVMTWDGYAGVVVIYVNGTSQGMCFTGLSSATLYPAIATYAANRAGCLLRAEEVAELPVIAPPPVAAAAATSSGASFDRSKSGPGSGSLDFSEGDTVVRSSNSTNSLAVVNRGFTGVRASWEFRVVHEEANNEVRTSKGAVGGGGSCLGGSIASHGVTRARARVQGTVYGAAFSAPPTNFDYSSNEGGVYLRCYNGARAWRRRGWEGMWARLLLGVPTAQGNCTARLATARWPPRRCTTSARATPSRCCLTGWRARWPT